MVFTVGDLRKALEGCEDSEPVLLSVTGGPADRFETIIQRESSRRERTVTLWGYKYNTREVGNAYQANDDRYGSHVLCIEVGEESP